MGLHFHAFHLVPAAAVAALKLATALGVAVVALAALTGHALIAEAPSTPGITDPTGFGGPLPERVSPRPPQRVDAPPVRYRLERVPCAAAAPASTRCYAAPLSPSSEG